MPKITIERPKKWNSEFKGIDVYIDGTKVGQLSPEKTTTFEVDAAKHILTLKGQLRGGTPSIDIDLSDNKDKTIRVHHSKQLPKIIWRGLFLTWAISLTLVLCFKIEHMWYIYIPTFVIILLVQQYLTSKIEHFKLKIAD